MKPAFLFTGNKASCDKWGALGKAEPALNRVSSCRIGVSSPLPTAPADAMSVFSFPLQKMSVITGGSNFRQGACDTYTAHARSARFNQ